MSEKKKSKIFYYVVYKWKRLKDKEWRTSAKVINKHPLSYLKDLKAGNKKAHGTDREEQHVIVFWDKISEKRYESMKDMIF